MKRTGKTWDDIPEPRASINDVDDATVKQFLKDARIAKRINVEDDIRISDFLEKLRLFEDGYLKRAAIVLFGKDPGKFYPNIAVKIGKFGTCFPSKSQYKFLTIRLPEVSVIYF